MQQYRGLTKEEVKESRRRNGDNQLTPKKQKTFWQTYWSKYDDPIIIILLTALGINMIFTFFGKVDWHECAGILVSVLLSTFVSSLSEFNNENTFQKLQEEASKTICKVYRDGVLTEIPIGEIVVGDFIVLQSGDMIPADGKVVDGAMMVDQSSLNGESKEICKQKPKDTRNQSHDFWDEETVYRGSVVCSGECVMQAETVGDATVYGRLTAETQTNDRISPLSVKLEHLAKSISRFGYLGAILLIIVSFLQNSLLANHFDPVLIAAYFADGGQVLSDLITSLIMGIIVIVVAVPEGLPLMIAIVCSLNMKKMLKSRVLVRKLIGIETAGGINILFSDKTGTITKGKLEVVQFLDATGKEYSGFGTIPKALQKILGISIMANASAKLSGRKIIGGNATEKALLSFIKNGNQYLEGIETVKKIPFQSSVKFSAVQIRGKQNLTLVKGAPEGILAKCREYYTVDGKTLPFKDKLQIEKKMEEMASKAIRLLAVAVTTNPLAKEAIPEDLVLVGIMAIRDEVRPEAKRAIRELHRAGIQTVMITGDRKETAVAVAKDAGLLNSEKDIVLTSRELGEMTDGKVKEILPHIRVIARALPTDKSRLVTLAQEMNLVVGMTGDGVNDAPALKKADVGFAMGSGSEVAKGAGDIVIMDDNFLSIRNAVLYGRTIYNSIKKFIQFQLTINVAAVTVSILGPIVGVEKPLEISQMIWTNLMIDTLAAIAFGGEPALNAYLLEKPKRREEHILDKGMWNSIIVCGLYICALSLFMFISPQIRNWFRPGDNDIYYYTGYFTFFIFICIFNAFNTRTDSIDLLDHLSLNKQFLTVMCGIGLTQVIMTYCGGNILRTAGLILREWALILTLALSVIPVDMIRKTMVQRRKLTEKHPQSGVTTRQGSNGFEA